MPRTDDTRLGQDAGLAPREEEEEEEEDRTTWLAGADGPVVAVDATVATVTARGCSRIRLFDAEDRLLNATDLVGPDHVARFPLPQHAPRPLTLRAVADCPTGTWASAPLVTHAGVLAPALAQVRDLVAAYPGDKLSGVHLKATLGLGGGAAASPSSSQADLL